jgi:hypothetical protein
MPTGRVIRGRIAAVAAVAAALLTPSVATADEVVAELAKDTPIAAYGGVLAWSSYDAASGRYTLTIKRREPWGVDVVEPARIATATRPFDVSLGPDSKGRTVALYTRCRTSTRGCDIYRYELRTRSERRLSSVSSPSLDEAWPAQWRDRIAFVRRARTHVVDGYDHRPDPRGRGPLLACDIPYVKTTTSSTPSRRLDRAHCGTTTAIAIRDQSIVQVTDLNQGGAGSESDVRLLRARGGSATQLARTAGGEGGYSPFSSPSLTASAVFLTRTGLRQDVSQGFVRIDLASRRLTTVAANVELAGAVKRDERGGFWYVEGPEPHFDFHAEPPFCRSPYQPCRLVHASASPFSAAQRTLLPRLEVGAFAGTPAVLSGTLTQAVVSAGSVVRREPLPGVALGLLRNDDPNEEGPYVDTALATTTAADGRWAFAPPAMAPDALYVVVAPLLRLASSPATSP